MTALATPLERAVLPREAVPKWLRLLWDVALPLRFDAEAPYLSAGTLHLPPAADGPGQAAAAAHAAAHLVYSPATFDGEGLVPIARVLVATLEDARVEALATRELPGLARLWRPLHTATPELGDGFEALLARLARALADPGYADPHAWVRRGRALFFLDADAGLLALRTPGEVRAAALALGRDIGQARLPFNHRGYRPAPDYRDDHRWMWAAEQLHAAPPPALAPGGALSDDPPDTAAEDVRVRRYPEWDRLIGRHRPAWATVIERVIDPAAGPPAGAAQVIEPAGGVARAAPPGESLISDRRLRPVLRRLAVRQPRPDPEGEILDLRAAVERRIARLSRNAEDGCPTFGEFRRAGAGSVALLVDHSASSADPFDGGPTTLLEATIGVAAALVRALESGGLRCAVFGFASRGRHAVGIERLKDFRTRADAGLEAGLAALRPGGSTRLGAVIRHASARLGARAGPHWLLLISDGEVHDIDVHDPRYLVEDARRAVAAARRRGVRTACLAPGPAGAGARRIFDADRVATFETVQALSRALARVVG